MAKQLGISQSSSAFEQINQIRTELSEVGLDPKRIDELLVQKGGIEEILSNNQLLSQYFKKVAFALGELTQWKYDDDKDRSLSSEVQSPAAYSQYFKESSDVQIPHQTYFPSKELFNYQGMVKGGYLNTSQAKALKVLAEQGLDGAPKFLQQVMGINLKELIPQNNELPPMTPTQEAPPANQEENDYDQDFLTKSTYPGDAPGYDPYANNYDPYGYGQWGSPTQYERTLMDGLPLDSVANSFFEVMFGKSDMARGVTASIMADIERKRAARRQIVDMMSKLDPTDPQQAQQLMGLREQLNEFDSSMQMDYSKLSQAKSFEDQIKQFIDSVMDKYNNTQASIIKNMA